MRHRVLLGLAAAALAGAAGALPAGGARPDRLQAFRLRYPGLAHVTLDRATGLPSELLGSGVRVAPGELTAAAVREIGSRFVGENRSFLGLEGLEARGEPRLAGSVWYLNLRLSRDGVPLAATSRVDLRFKPHGVLAAVLTSGIPRGYEGDPTRPARRAAEAIRAAISAAADLGARARLAGPPAPPPPSGDRGR